MQWHGQFPIITYQCFSYQKASLRSLHKSRQNTDGAIFVRKKGVHRCSQKKLAKLKVKGGLGLRDLELFNLHFLAKKA
ncbi:hypothetical protein Syun_017220 [Stephania yunnanensis]|uniref:Uncharacterized protein n=1 Tax=Stephania yunnanensis TaxID=152371 RepID=A0AAP0P2V5_9MAGN